MPVKLSEHFTEAELNCHCGCGKTVDPNLLQKLEEMRFEYGKQIIVTSGARCEEHNRKEGGKPGSLHLKGLAVDIVCTDAASRYELVRIAYELEFTGIGIAKTFIHLDLRPVPSVCFLY
jgi:uncharacterized protein YcbK (DUF882 family)